MKPGVGHQQTVTAIAQRLAIHALQQNLEDAWQCAAGQFQSLNRPLVTAKFPPGPAQTILAEAEHKHRELEALEQRAFLLFHTLTQEKHLEQVNTAIRIRDELAQNHNPDVGEFLEREERLHKEFLTDMRTTRNAITGLLMDTHRVRILPCRDATLEQNILDELDTLQKFLTDAGQLLMGSPQPA